MGLDISLCCDNHERILTDDYYDEEGDDHQLSRTFCNLMCRKDVVEQEPELDQIGRLTGIDITPLYRMEEYPAPDGFRLWIGPDDVNLRREAREAEERERAGFPSNLDHVAQTVGRLIESLSKIDDLPARLLPTDFDTLENAVYFAAFNTDPGDGYIGNNFGQDLRNLQRALKYIKTLGATTVWFNYG